MEIMLAITIMSVVLLALGSLMFQATRDMNRTGAVAYRSAAQLSAISWAQSLPFDSLTSATYQSQVVGCVTDTTGQLIYNRCTTVQVISGKDTRITLVITPTNLTGKSDTVVVERNRPLVASPFF
ncbi:MAG: hypothetical protein HY700_07425 [Gemmatimonadetes bacterium]|nr:hypothetical protein [Gemmatimonadota bacterium]